MSRLGTSFLMFDSVKQIFQEKRFLQKASKARQSKQMILIFSFLMPDLHLPKTLLDVSFLICASITETAVKNLTISIQGLLSI